MQQLFWHQILTHDTTENTFAIESSIAAASPAGVVSRSNKLSLKRFCENCIRRFRQQSSSRVYVLIEVHEVFSMMLSDLHSKCIALLWRLPAVEFEPYLAKTFAKLKWIWRMGNQAHFFPKGNGLLRIYIFSQISFKSCQIKFVDFKVESTKTRHC